MLFSSNPPPNLLDQDDDDDVMEIARQSSNDAFQTSASSSSSSSSLAAAAAAATPSPPARLGVQEIPPEPTRNPHFDLQKMHREGHTINDAIKRDHRGVFWRNPVDFAKYIDSCKKQFDAANAASKTAQSKQDYYVDVKNEHVAQGMLDLYERITDPEVAPRVVGNVRFTRNEFSRKRYILPSMEEGEAKQAMTALITALFPESPPMRCLSDVALGQLAVSV